MMTMIETEFKALMHTGAYIDANLLHKGIYSCTKPFIYSKEETIESLVERSKRMKDMSRAAFINETYFKNLQECTLVPIFVKIKKV